jgi:hypothetical protein
MELGSKNDASSDRTTCQRVADAVPSIRRPRLKFLPAASSIDVEE